MWAWQVRREVFLLASSSPVNNADVLQDLITTRHSLAQVPLGRLRPALVRSLVTAIDGASLCHCLPSVPTPLGRPYAGKRRITTLWFVLSLALKLRSTWGTHHTHTL